MEQVVYPLGLEAGKEMVLAAALRQLALEMLQNRSDLLERAAITKHYELKMAYELRAEELENYAAALYSLAVQAAPDEFTPEAVRELLGMAQKHGLFLPDWLTKDQ